jgi:hypothetical protein
MHMPTTDRVTTKQCPQCRRTLVLTIRYPAVTAMTGSIRTGTEPHDGPDRLHYEQAWVCQNVRCDYRELVGEPTRTEPTPDDVTTKQPELSPQRTRRTAHVTSTPHPPAPPLFCPTCDRSLVYRQTVVGGVKPLERWDYFDCRTCGSFVYRDRTRRLRRAV